MSLIQFIHLISITVYAGLAAYILTRNPKDRLVRISALYLLCFLIWSISYFLAHNPNISIGQTKLLYNLGSFGWLPFSSAFVWVVFMMTGKEKMLKNKIFRLVSFSIPVLLMYPAWSGKLLTDFVKQPFGWSYNWSLNVWTYLFFAYIGVFITAGLLVLYGYAKREKDVRKKGPAWLLFLATVIATPLGVMTNIVAQLLKLYEIPPMASDVALIWAVCLVYAIVRYEFLAVTPAAAAKNIISTMTDSLILLDEKGKISTVNSATCDLLGYEKEELIGKDLTSLFSSHSIGKLNVTGEEFIGLIEEETFTGRELTYLTKEGERLPVLLSASVIRSRPGALRGIIVLARDITGIKKTEEELRGLNEQLKENERAVLNVLSDLENSHEELKSSQE
ncbi:MAG: PAS domain S-box protein, partial [Candidatus Omnitrophota bacterium]